MMVRSRKGKKIAALSGYRDDVPPPYGLSSETTPSLTVPLSPTVPSLFSVPDHDTVPPTHDSASGSVAASPSIGSTQHRGIFIEPHGAELTHQFKCAQHVGHVIERFYNRPWKSWKAIPRDVRDRWFEEWGKGFIWREDDVYAIRKNFEHIGSNNLKNRLHRARSSNIRPSWIGEVTWNELKMIWGDHKFEKESERNKKNRASDCGEQGFPLHMAGCVSFGEHARRLMQEHGHKPTLADTFLKVHSKSNKIGHRVWVNDWARITYETHTQRINEISSQNLNNEDNENELDSGLTELKVWTEIVGGPKKGRLRGLGGQASFGAHSISSASTSYPPFTWQTERTDLLNNIDKVNRENKTLRQEVQTCKDAIATLQTQFAAFQQSMPPPPNAGLSQPDNEANQSEEQIDSSDD